MRSPEEKRSDPTGTRQESQSAERSSTAQSGQQGSSDVARPVSSSTEPGRTARTGVTTRRPGYLTSPWDLVRNMSEEVDRLIDGLSGLRGSTAYGLTTPRSLRTGSDFGVMTPAAWAPQVEVLQKPNAVVLRADLPGLKPDEVNVSVDNDVLTISGERRQEQREEREGYFRSERSYGTFHRAFTLPDAADEDKISASFKDGVLEITIPLAAEKERGRKIKVQT